MNLTYSTWEIKIVDGDWNPEGRLAYAAVEHARYGAADSKISIVLYVFFQQYVYVI